MRRIIFLAVPFLFVSLTVSAQTKEEKAARKHQEAIEKSREKGTVILDQDTIYNAGVAYAVLKNEGSVLKPKYRAYALSGKEAFFVDGTVVTNFWHFRFATLEGREIDVPMDIAVPIHKMIVDNELMSPEGLDEAKARYFLVRYGPHKTGATPGAPITQVARNRKAIIMAYDHKILQDGKVIGTYETKSENTKEYGPKKVVRIYFASGALCAKAILEAAGENTASVTTEMDNKTQTVTDPVLEVDDIAKYLVDNSYL